MLRIRTATIYKPEIQLQDAAILIDDEGVIVEVGSAGTVARPHGVQEIDGRGLLAVPGFIDLQLNGGFGYDFTDDPSTVWQVAARLPEHGVTAFLPTVITSPLPQVASAQEVMRDGPPPGSRGAAALGLHLEGPFINPGKRGAHNPAHLRTPDLMAVAGWRPETGVRLVTLAPELPGALDLVRALADRGVLVSAGHSLATFEQALAGFDAGIRYGTHLYNAMPPLDHRAPGLIAALLTDERVAFGLIPDGIHSHPAMVDMAWRTAYPGRFSVVTDAMAALGMPAGQYRLGELDVTVDATSARLADGRLAGSILDMPAAVRNLVAFTGCSLADALGAVTTTPARLLRLEHERGRLAPGCAGDVVLMTPDLRVVRTIIGGETVFEAR